MDNNFYTKKITPYLDGSLSSEEHSEFEAFVSTHPEAQEEIQKRKEEIIQLKELIPVPNLTQESLDVLKSEMKQSILNLLKDEPKNFSERVKQRWEEWFNR